MAKKKLKNQIRITKTKLIVFAVIVVILAVTLPFSAFFENKLDSVLRKNYGDFNTATSQKCVFHVLDVGNGDCLALELPDGKKMLIDCGMDIKSTKKDYKTNTVNYLTEVVFNGEKNSENRVFDYLILTHPHDDHYKMAKTIFDNFKINTVYRPAVFYYKDDETALSNTELQRAKNAGFVDSSVTTLKNSSDVATISSANYKTFLNCMESEESNVFYTYQGASGFTITGDSYELKSYWPVSLDLGTSDLNIYSPIIIFSYNNHSICLTGDSVTESENYVADHYNLPMVDLLKVGHHGSAGASTSKFLNEIKPTYAFVSCSSDNSYGHPNEKALTRIKESGTLSNNILMTKDSGNLVFAITDSAEIMVAASDGIVFVKIRWWYVCGTVLILCAVVIFCTKSTAKKVLKNSNVKKIVKKWLNF